MRVIVQKYGGSSVATVEKLQLVAQQVTQARAAGYQVVVVVSAMGNTTDELLDLARQVQAEPPRRELDMLLSVGERISMALLSIAIDSLGYEAISFTGSQCGIITTDSHTNARIIDVRPFRVQDELERGKVVIVAGYQGTSYKREVTTLGRGGSDTTAVALAAALGAERCEIYSDVDGVYTADPRVVLDASRLDELSYEEMQELARQGARVLNAQAVEYARRHKIALYARKTGSGDVGTVVQRVDATEESGPLDAGRAGVRSVAGRDDLILISFEGVSAGEDRTAALLAELHDVDILFAVTQPEIDRCDILVSAENLPSVDAFAESWRRDYADTVTVTTGLASASAVGLGVGDRTEALQRAQDALVGDRIPYVMSFTAREAVTIVVRAHMQERAQQLIHEAFLGKKRPSG